MAHNFILFHAENVNENKDSICHIILIPVIDVEQNPIEFFVNPNAPFERVMSGITASQVAEFQNFEDLWPEIQKILAGFPFVVCTADGYSAHALYGTLMRLNVSFEAIPYCNAKAICRRTLDEVSYSIDFLNFKYFDDYVSSENPVLIAKRWVHFVLMGLKDFSEYPMIDLATELKIQIGRIEPNNFIPCQCLRNKTYSKASAVKFDPSGIEVKEDPGNPFFGQNVVFTGKLESLKRADARAAVIRVGGKAPDGFNKETNFLVVGTQDLRVVGEKGLSQKMKTAMKYKEAGLPIEIIDEADFLSMIGSENLPNKPYVEMTEDGIKIVFSF